MLNCRRSTSLRQPWTVAPKVVPERSLVSSTTGGQPLSSEAYPERLPKLSAEQQHCVDTDNRAAPLFWTRSSSSLNVGEVPYVRILPGAFRFLPARSGETLHYSACCLGGARAKQQRLMMPAQFWPATILMTHRNGIHGLVEGKRFLSEEAEYTAPLAFAPLRSGPVSGPAESAVPSSKSRVCRLSTALVAQLGDDAVGFYPPQSLAGSCLPSMSMWARGTTPPESSVVYTRPWLPTWQVPATLPALRVADWAGSRVWHQPWVVSADVLAGLIFEMLAPDPHLRTPLPRRGGAAAKTAHVRPSGVIRKSIGLAVAIVADAAHLFTGRWARKP